MKHRTTTRLSFLLLLSGLFALPLFAGKPAPAVPPPTPIYSGLFDFHSSTQVFNAAINVPADGAWIFGNATYRGGSYMDCDHHYEVDLVPSALSPDYTPFLQMGYVSGIDTPCTFSNACFSCSLNFGGFKPKTYFTTNNGPGWLPAGTGTATLRTLNGGAVSDGDEVALTLSQVNAVDLQTMTVFEAMANDNPAPASQAEIDSRAYIAGGDRVPLVAEFSYGTYGPFPAPLSATYSATWDTGDNALVQTANPYGHPGYTIALVNVPKMSTGTHKVTLTAKLPSGKTFTAVAYQVFVFNVAMEASVNGGPAITTSPVSFTRGATVAFRIAQQDTKGKAIAITKTDWKFHNFSTGVDVLSANEPNFPPAATEWSGVMHQNGTVSASVTIQTGKTTRTGYGKVIMTATGTARNYASWQPSQWLCENCFDDLGIKNGGRVDWALVFPSLQNATVATKPFAANGGKGGVTLAVTGERLGYENGIKEDNDAWALEPHTLLKPYPLYRPFNLKNDPAEWPNRYTLAHIDNGPNRGYWYVTGHKFHTEWAYALSAWFDPTSGPGADSTNYYTFDQACPTPDADITCWQPTPLACWQTAHPNLSYYEVGVSTINPNTGATYDMDGIATDVRWHEKNRHWQQWLVDYINANKQKYDVGTLLELITTRDATEQSARVAIDLFIEQINQTYAKDPLGGANEIYNDPVRPFPIINDLPLGAANCALYPSH